MPKSHWELTIKDRLPQIEKWISEGMAEYSICLELGVSNAVWFDTKNKHPELQESIMRGRRQAGSLVLNAQARAASGHTVRLLKQKVARDGTVYDTYEDVYYPPNPQAAEFWGRHIMPGYVAPRSDAASAVTVNVQLPQIQADIARLTQARQELERELAVIDVTPEPQEPQETHAEDRTDTGGKQDAAGAQAGAQADEQTDEHDPF